MRFYCPLRGRPRRGLLKNIFSRSCRATLRFFEDSLKLIVARILYQNQLKATAKPIKINSRRSPRSHSGSSSRFFNPFENHLKNFKGRLRAFEDHSQIVKAYLKIDSIPTNSRLFKYLLNNLVIK